MKRFSGLLVMVFTVLGAHAQGDEKYGDTPEQQLLCKESLSIYKNFMKQKNYKDAYPAWTEACKQCPPKASQTLYSDGAKLLKNEIKSAEADKKKVLVDSLMMVYDQRMELFPSTSRSPNNRCKVLGYKAGDTQKYLKDQIAEANSMYKESFECLGNKSSAATISGYYLTSYKLLQKAEGDAADDLRSDMLTEYLTIQEVADYNIANGTKEKTIEGYKKAKANIDEIFVIIAECESMVPTFEKKVNADPENMDLMKKALKLMNTKDCTESDFYLMVAEKVHQAEPSAESAYAVGMGYLKKSEYSQSMGYMVEAVKLCEDCPDKEKYLLRTGQVATILKQSSKARSYANKVLQINPNSGGAIMLIGDAIVAGAGQCDDGGIGKRAMYWLAVDYYAKAKRVDSTVTDKAQKKINTYSAQFPSTEDCFKFGLSKGDSFTTCIGESTTVRPI